MYCNTQLFIYLLFFLISLFLKLGSVARKSRTQFNLNYDFYTKFGKHVGNNFIGVFEMYIYKNYL